MLYIDDVILSELSMLSEASVRVVKVSRAFNTLTNFFLKVKRLGIFKVTHVDSC